MEVPQLRYLLSRKKAYHRILLLKWPWIKLRIGDSPPRPNSINLQFCRRILRKRTVSRELKVKRSFSRRDELYLTTISQDPHLMKFKGTLTTRRVDRCLYLWTKWRIRVRLIAFCRRSLMSRRKNSWKNQRNWTFTPLMNRQLIGTSLLQRAVVLKRSTKNFLHLLVVIKRNEDQCSQSISKEAILFLLIMDKINRENSLNLRNLFQCKNPFKIVLSIR